MTEVFIVYRWLDYEGDDVVAVFSTREAADAEADRRGRGGVGTGRGHDVIHAVVDAPEGDVTYL